VVENPALINKLADFEAKIGNFEQLWADKQRD
jgi:hypothetical protein